MKTLEIIRVAQFKKVQVTRIEYKFKEDPSHGFFFDTEDEKIVFRSLKAKENWKYVQENKEFFIETKTTKEVTKRYPTLGKCPHCGKIIVAEGLNQCECGTIYLDDKEVDYDSVYLV